MTMYASMNSSTQMLTGRWFYVPNSFEPSAGEEEVSFDDFDFQGNPVEAHKIIGGVPVFQTDLQHIPHVVDISSDATDTDGDGVDDIAKGTANFATLTLQKKDTQETSLVAAGDDDTVFLRPSKGTITNTGDVNLYKVDLVNGAVTLRWHAADEMGLAELEVVSDNPNIEPSYYKLAFR